MKKSIIFLFLSVMLTACSSNQSVQSNTSAVLGDQSAATAANAGQQKQSHPPVSKKQNAAKQTQSKKKLSLSKAKPKAKIPSYLIPVTVSKEVDGLSPYICTNINCT